jgi:hypothetical protein
MTHTKDEALKLAAEFDKRFTSMNGVDVPERVSVPRDEWRALKQAIKQALAAPTVKHLCTAAMFDEAFLAKSGLDPNTKLYTTPPLPIKPIVDPGLDASQKLAFKLGWKSAEEAHNITKGQT